MSKILYFPIYKLIYETKTYYYISSYGMSWEHHVFTMRYLEKKYGNAAILSKSSYVPNKVKEWLKSLTEEDNKVYELIQIKK